MGAVIRIRLNKLTSTPNSSEIIPCLKNNKVNRAVFVILRISLEVVFCQQERDRADVPTLILYEDLKVFYFVKNKREFGISLKFKITVVFV